MEKVYVHSRESGRFQDIRRVYGRGIDQLAQSYYIFIINI